MQIVCPTCATGYDVAPSSLGTAGRSVRCVRCRTVWFATPPLATAVGAPASPAEATGAEWSSWSEEEPPAASQSEAAAPAIVDGEVIFSATATPIDAPPLAPMDADLASLPAADPSFAGPREDIETAAARHTQPRSSSRRFGLPRLRLSGALLALVAAHAALIAGRVDVVRLMPQTGSLYALIGLPVNLRGLAIDDVKTSRETHDGVPVLVVEGTLANVARAPLEVPRLRFAVRNDRGAELYAWTAPPARAILNPGELVAFRSRLASPPGEGRAVIVRFFNRRDSAAGLR